MDYGVCCNVTRTVKLILTTSDSTGYDTAILYYSYWRGFAGRWRVVSARVGQLKLVHEVRALRRLDEVVLQNPEGRECTQANCTMHGMCLCQFQFNALFRNFMGRYTSRRLSFLGRLRFLPVVESYLRVIRSFVFIFEIQPFGGIGDHSCTHPQGANP